MDNLHTYCVVSDQLLELVNTTKQIDAFASIEIIRFQNPEVTTFQHGISQVHFCCLLGFGHQVRMRN